MAYERKSTKAKGDSLDSFVTNIADAFMNQMKIRNAQEESSFNRAVLEDGLSLEDQLSYRQDQLKKVSDDPSEKLRIRGEISSLKERIKQKQFSDAYQVKLMDYGSGMSSIDTVIDFLTQQKATITDPTILASINQELVTQTQNKYTITKNLITDQTNYALNDKTIPILDAQIAKITSEKAKALIANNEPQVANLNLQLQALNKAKIEASISKDIQNFAATTITGYSTATSLLDAYNDKIGGSSDSTPITIGGVTYSSGKEFWTYKRDSFIADSSSSGLFARLNDEATAKIQTAASKNNLTSRSLINYSEDVSDLAGRPELAGYESKIDQTKQSILQTGANLITDSITNKYSIDYDINKAVNSLNELKAVGVNVDAAYSKIIIAGSSVKSGQVSSILSAAQNALTNNPNLTPEAAINMAIQSGAAIVKTPEELAKDSAGKLATDLATTTDATGQTNNPKFSTETVTPESTPTSTVGNLQIGSSGERVKQVQLALGITPDGVFGPQTKAAVIAYQQSHGLTVDGIVGPQTSGVLLKTTPVKTTTTPVKTTNTQTNTQTKTNPQPTPIKNTPAPTPVVTPTVSTPKSTYNGSSIVDYLGTVGQDSSYAARAKLAASKGITNYTGSASQNTQLLKTLRGF